MRELSAQLGGFIQVSEKDIQHLLHNFIIDIIIVKNEIKI